MRQDHRAGLLLGLAAATLFAPLARAELVPRTSIAEMFGDPICTDCPESRAALETLEMELNRDDFVFIEYHTSAELSNPDATARHAYYGNEAIPAAFFDGELPTGTGRAGLETYREVVQAHLAEMSPLNVAADYFFDQAPGFVNVEVEVAFGEVIDRPETWMIRAVIWEDSVEDDFGLRWNRVARAVLPEEPLAVSLGGESQVVTWEVEIEPSWRADFLGAVVFVQRDSDHFVLNASRGIDGGSLNPIPPGPFDPFGITLFQNKPNPARGETRIAWSTTKPEWVVLKIYNVHGQVVRVLNDGPRGDGLHEVVWDGTDFTGRRLMSGLYVYELSTPEGNRSKRLTLLR